MAEQNIGKSIMLKDIDQRNCSTRCHQKYLKQVGSIKAFDTGIDKNICNMMPMYYLQESYLSTNSCVWISTCIAVHSIDPIHIEKMLRTF